MCAVLVFGGERRDDKSWDAKETVEIINGRVRITRPKWIAIEINALAERPSKESFWSKDEDVVMI